MTVNYITGSAAKNNGGAIAGVTTSTTQVDAVSNMGKPATTPRAKVSDKVTSITQATGAAVGSIQNVNGSFAFRLSSAPTAGTSLSITGADYPINGVYLVHAASGVWALTSTPYHVCGAITASGNYTLSDTASNIDPPAQREEIIMNYTSSIKGAANDALFGNTRPANRRSVNKFEGYRHLVYNDGYLNWDGVHNKCDYASSGVALGTDDAYTGNPTVVFDTGANIRAADLDLPDTTAMRAPAQGTVEPTIS